MSTLGPVAVARADPADPVESVLPEVWALPIGDLIESRQDVLANSMRRLLDGPAGDGIAEFSNRAD